MYNFQVDIFSLYFQIGLRQDFINANKFFEGTSEKSFEYSDGTFLFCQVFRCMTTLISARENKFPKGSTDRNCSLDAVSGLSKLKRKLLTAHRDLTAQVTAGEDGSMGRLY